MSAARKTPGLPHDQPIAVPRLSRGLRSAVRSAGLPYGYTVTLWSSGQVLIRFHGTPNLAVIGLFAAGALVGYAVLQAVALRSDPPDDVALGSSGSWIHGGAMQGAAAALTLLAVAAAGALSRPSWRGRSAA